LNRSKARVDEYDEEARKEESFKFEGANTGAEQQDREYNFLKSVTWKSAKAT